MTTRSNRYACLVGLLAVSLLSTCRPADDLGMLPSFTNGRTDFLEEFAFAVRPDARFGSRQSALSGPVWKDSQFTLSRRLVDDEKPYQFKDNELVMVSFWSGTTLADELRDHPATVLFRDPPAPARGLALVNLADAPQNYLDHVAMAAHSHYGAGCGNVEVLNLALVADGLSAPTPPVYSELVKLPEVEALTAQVRRSNLEQTIQTLEARGTRWHTTASGLGTPDAIQTLFASAAAGLTPAPQYQQIDHAGTGRTQQKSLVVALPGQTEDDVTVIIGAHLDSTSPPNASGALAPGADDDATGIATMVEAMRIIAAGNNKFRRRIEFHAYGAEEIGLVGSKDIATRYETAGRRVAGMLQIDMTAFAKNPSDTTIWLVTNDTSATLRRSLKDLLTTYLGGGFQEMGLMGGSSDHRSWTSAGFHAVFPFQHPVDFNKRLHTDGDTFANLNNFPLAERFARMTLAFLAHHAGLVSAENSYATLAEGLEGEDTDLALAVVNARDTGVGSDGEVQIAVAANEKVASVEACAIAAADARTCSGERLLLTQASDDGLPAGRKFFVSEVIPAPTDGSLWRLFGYDDKDALESLRTVRLAAKP